MKIRELFESTFPVIEESTSFDNLRRTIIKVLANDERHLDPAYSRHLEGPAIHRMHQEVVAAMRAKFPNIELKEPAKDGHSVASVANSLSVLMCNLNEMSVNLRLPVSIANFLSIEKALVIASNAKPSDEIVNLVTDQFVQLSAILHYIRRHV